MTKLLMAVAAVLAIAVGSAEAGQPSPSTCSFGPPASIHKVIQIYSSSGRAHGFAVTLQDVITANHAVKGVPEVFYHSGFDGGIEGPLSPVEADEKHDVAQLRTDRPLAALMEFAGEEPLVGSVLWFAGYQFNEDRPYKDNYYWGLYMGRDEEGHMVVDSSGVEGFSGGPLLNTDGKVVGVMILYGHPSQVYEDFDCNLSKVAEWSCQIQFLSFVTKHRSMVFAQPMWKKR